MDITAVVPVRAGSRRLKNKNIAPFAGTNLLLHKIAQLQQVAAISRIVVTSDSDTMLDMALAAGAESHKRAIEYCDEQTRTFGEVVEHVCRAVPGETVLWATCTSPLVTSEHYEKAIEAYPQAIDAGFDSLMSVEAFKRYVWNDTGPINYQLGTKHVPSQQLPELFFVTDGILMAPRQKMIQWKYFHGVNPYKFRVDKRAGVDVDDTLDLLVAQAWFAAGQVAANPNAVSGGRPTGKPAKAA